MVTTRRTLPLLAPIAVLAAACGPDVPTKCTTSTAEQRAAILSFSNDKVDENPLRYCVGVNVAARRDATSTSPGKDDSFATSRAGVIPWTNVTYSEAAAACGRAGRFLCERRVLRALHPYEILATGFVYDDRWIDALSPTGDRTPPDQLAPIALLEEHVPAVAEGSYESVYPDAGGSVAVWTAEGYVMGRIVGGDAQSGDPTAYAEVRPGFKHPLLGFRCCLDARLESIFEPLPPDPALIRAEVDDVPIH